MVRVASNNRVTVATAGASGRLPLGATVAAGSGSTRWKLWIPTELGGLLRITQPATTSIDIQQPLGTSLATGTTDETTIVAFGECWVLLNGAAGSLTATLTQSFCAREDGNDPTSAPLLPWTFFYWPSARSSPYAAQARGIIRKYATAVGKDPTSTSDWEYENHEPAGSAGWAGHCHNAAPASALFLSPVATTIHSASFTDEELKYLASEWFGNFGVVGFQWGLSSALGIPKPGRWDVLGYIKPGGPKGRDVLLQGFQSEMPAAVATAKADAILAQAGDAATLANQLKGALGKNAAAFFTGLQELIAKQGQPLLSNMRAYFGANGPEEVWNQVFFYYVATLVETVQTPFDDHDITVNCKVYSNIDHYPSTGFPATISGNSVTPGTSGVDCQMYDNTWRLIFNGTGAISTSDARNEWQALKSGSGDDLYAPTDLFTIKKPQSTLRAGLSPFSLGNPALGTEFLAYVTIHPRYT